MRKTHRHTKRKELGYINVLFKYRRGAMIRQEGQWGRVLLRDQAGMASRSFSMVEVQALTIFSSSP